MITKGVSSQLKHTENKLIQSQVLKKMTWLESSGFYYIFEVECQQRHDVALFSCFYLLFESPERVLVEAQRNGMVILNITKVGNTFKAI